VPKVQNLHEIWAFVDAVINQYRRVNELANTWASRDRGSDVRIALQQMDVIQDCSAESLRILGKPLPGIRENLREIR
jgi:hypothetical protein